MCMDRELSFSGLCAHAWPVIPPSFRRALALAALALSLGAARAGERVYPDDVFRPYAFVDVTKPPYSVDNTGKEDVTEKLRQAMTDIYHLGQPAFRLKTLYFPNGTYRISDTLDAMAPNKDGKLAAVHRLLWIGQSRDGTILKLDDNLPAFQDAAKPKGMIRTESIGTNGNDAYDNCVANMTFDVGAGNPGAAGIDYLANNNGWLRDVLIKAAPGSGAVGLLMTRPWPGPDYVRGLEVDGFDYGIRLSRMEYSITFEHIVLRGQRKAGLHNEDNGAFIRDLESVNAVPAVENASKGGLVVLVGGRLKGGDPGAAAVSNVAGLFLRDVTTEGYGTAVKDAAGPGAPAGTVAEYSSPAPVTCKGFAASRTTSLALEIRDAPEFEDNDFSHWYSVGRKAQPDQGNADQADAIQSAIDEAAAQGKTTLYFLPGQYMIGHPLEFHGSLRRVLGFGSILRVKGGPAFADAAHPQPALRVRDVAGDAFEIDLLLIAASLDHPPGFYGVEHDSDKPLVVRDIEVNGMGQKGPLAGYQGTANAGDVYLEGVVANRWIFNRPGQRVWARQLDAEGNVSPRVTNSGAKLWVLGYKTERPGTLIESLHGAETEVLGGLFYPVIQPTDDPMFRVEDSRFSISYVTIANNAAADCPNHLLETRAGVTQALGRGDIPPRPCFGGASAAMAALMVAAPADAPAPSPTSP